MAMTNHGPAAAATRAMSRSGRTSASSIVGDSKVGGSYCMLIHDEVAMRKCAGGGVLCRQIRQIHPRPSTTDFREPKVLRLNRPFAASRHNPCRAWAMESLIETAICCMTEASR